MTVSEMVKKYNLSKGLLNYRIAKGLTGDALIAPPQENPLLNTLNMKMSR